MDIKYLAKLQRDLCNLHNELSAKIIQMQYTDPLYKQANETADDIYNASTNAYTLLKMASRT